MTTPRELLARYTTQSQMSSFFIDHVGIISVKSYGAKGDGATDDTVAVQAAVTAAVANGNHELYFPHGIYKVTALTGVSTLTFVGDNSSFTGGYSGTINSLSAHLANTTTAHGAVSAATASKIIIRDAAGRAKVVAPSAEDDIALKSNVTTVQTNLTEHQADTANQIRVGLFANQSFSASTGGDVIFDTKLDDNTSLFSLNVLTGEITVLKAGTYTLSLGLRLQNTTDDGLRGFGGTIILNGSGVRGQSIVWDRNLSPAFNTVFLSLTTSLKLNVNDVVKSSISVNQTTTFVVVSSSTTSLIVRRED